MDEWTEDDWQESRRSDRQAEVTLEQFKEDRSCRKCVCYDGRVCDLDGEEKNPDKTCTEFEEWS